MSTKHTPGPWIVRHLAGFPLMIATAPDADGFGKPVADCSRHRLPGEALANARLIAAAPDLLEIAKAYRNLLRTMAHTDGDIATFHHVEAAIAQAEGR